LGRGTARGGHLVCTEKTSWVRFPGAPQTNKERVIMIDQSIRHIDFDEIDIYKFGNELEISGMILANGKEIYLVPFPNVEILNDGFINHVNMTKEDWNTMLFQMDHLEAIVRAKDETGKMQKIILRKSQRQIDTKIQWQVFKRDNYTCQYCGNNDVPLTIDHIIRWENMGQTHQDNLITACKKCNKTRGNTEMEDWLQSEYYLKVRPNEGWTKPIERLFEDAKELPLRKFERNR